MSVAGDQRNRPGPDSCGINHCARHMAIPQALGDRHLAERRFRHQPAMARLQIVKQSILQFGTQRRIESQPPLRIIRQRIKPRLRRLAHPRARRIAGKDLAPALSAPR